MKSFITHSKNGAKILNVKYDNAKADFDERIDEAIEKHNLKGRFNVICNPYHTLNLKKGERDDND